MRKYILITIILVCGKSGFMPGLYAQDKNAEPATITIYDANGMPVEDAAILYNEGSSVLKTDKMGQATISLNKLGNYVRVEAADYETKLLALDSISNRQQITITLTNPLYHTGELNLVNIPFGQMEKRRIVGAVTALKPDELLKYDTNQDVLTAISGRVAGVYGNRDIRGLGTAIIVIDGIPRSSSNSSDRLNMVDELNLSDIEEITVLKDAASKILYGAKADQGVILITTKRGVPFKRKLNVHAETGIRNPISYPNYLSASDYMTLYNEALSNDGLPAKYSSTDIDNTRNKVDPIRYPDESFYNSAYLKNNSTFYKVITEASGGNAKAQYFSSLGLSRNGSLFQSRGEKSTASEQLNFRGNVDYAVNNWISASIDAVAVYFTNRYPNGYYGDSYNGNLFEFAATQLPNSFPSLIPVDQVQNPALLESAKLVDGKYLLGGTNQFGNNILGNLVYGGLQSTQQKSIQFNSGLKFDLGSVVKGLSANANFTYDFLNSYTLRQNNQYAVYEPSYVLSSTGTDSLVVKQYGEDVKRNDQTVNGNYFQRRMGLYGTLQYKNTFNHVHQLDAVALSYMSAVQIGASAASRYDDMRTQHFGLRVNYMFANKYVAEFSGAYVGSPYLSTANRYAFSPSLGAAWIVSEESFLAENPVFNYLKLKASYGIIHSDNLYNTYRLYDASYARGGSFAYNDASGNMNNVTQFLSMANPDLKFVKYKDFNAGFEASLFTNRIWLEANYFNVRSVGEPTIRNAAYPVYLGGFIPTENYNESGNSGVEAALNYRGKAGTLQYTIGANMVYAVPRTLKLSEPQYAVPYRYREGKVSDAQFGLVAEGLFKDLDDIANHAEQTFGPVKPGDIKYKDLNNDGIINEDDQKQIGNSHARLQYGLTLNLRFRNFEFFALGVGRSGSTIYYNDSYYWVYGERKYSEVVLDRWTPETAETASYPRLTTGSGTNNFRNSTFWLYNNRFFSLNTAQLTYQLPGKHFWKGVQLYARGNNLFRISDTKKQQELNVASSPQMRSYIFGIVGSF